MVQRRILGYIFHYFPVRNIKPFVREIKTVSGQPQGTIEDRRVVLRVLHSTAFDRVLVTGSPSKSSSGQKISLAPTLLGF